MSLRTPDWRLASAVLLSTLAACSDAPVGPSTYRAPSGLRPGPISAALLGTATTPELPRVLLNTTYTAPAGRKLVVRAGGNLQAALDSARGGDLIALQPGTTYSGNFILPAKPAGTAWIVITTDTVLPPAGTRMTPARAARLAKLVSPQGAGVLSTRSGTHHWRIMGVEITAASGVTAMTNPLVGFGTGQSTQSVLSSIPSDLILDRVYVHGRSTMSLKRCIALNSARSAVIDSWVSECHSDSQDSQAIGGWNGPGPFKITNNHLAAAGENVMFGGAVPTIVNLVPADIEIRANYFVKPLVWKDRWLIKNLFELKFARRVLVEGNVFDNSWVDAQTGNAWLLKSEAPSTTTTWAVTEHVTMRYNLVRNVAAAMTLHGLTTAVGLPASHIRIEHNVFDGVGASNGTVNGRQVQLLGPLKNVTVAHNTFIPNTTTGQMVVLENKPLATNLVYNDQIQVRTGYGLIGSGAGGEGTPALNYYWTSWAFAGNVIVGATGTKYPTGNSFPSTLSEVGFVSLANRDYRLSATSPYLAKASDGTNPGANVDALTARTAGVVVAP